MVDKYTTFTDYASDDAIRPQLQIHLERGQIVAHLDVGKQELLLTINGYDKKDLRDQLEVYAEIFKAAANSLDEELQVKRGSKNFIINP